jgi:hypothetical protein
MNSFKHSYWCDRGRLKTLADKLHERIPQSGEIPAFPKLDKYRVACNCYHDLFNNGLCNRAAEFRGVFGFSPRRQYPKGSSIDFQNEEMNARLNAIFDLIVTEAAIEQGLWV